MRFALVTELEVDSGKRRCGVRVPRMETRMQMCMQARMQPIEAEPADAVKTRDHAARLVDSEPRNAAKGERGLANNGAITC